MPDTGPSVLGCSTGGGAALAWLAAGARVGDGEGEFFQFGD
jgi:hypothetical protein